MEEPSIKKTLKQKRKTAADNLVKVESRIQLAKKGVSLKQRIIILIRKMAFEKNQIAE
jgi:hypothetical protein